MTLAQALLYPGPDSVAVQDNGTWASASPNQVVIDSANSTDLVPLIGPSGELVSPRRGGGGGWAAAPGMGCRIQLAPGGASLWLWVSEHRT